MRVIYSRIIITRSWLCARLEEEVRARERARARVCLSTMCVRCVVCVRACVCACVPVASPRSPPRGAQRPRGASSEGWRPHSPHSGQRGAAKTSHHYRLLIVSSSQHAAERVGDISRVESPRQCPVSSRHKACLQAREREGVPHPVSATVLRLRARSPAVEMELWDRPGARWLGRRAGRGGGPGRDARVRACPHADPHADRHALGMLAHLPRRRRGASARVERRVDEPLLGRGVSPPAPR